MFLLISHRAWRASRAEPDLEFHEPLYQYARLGSLVTEPQGIKCHRAERAEVFARLIENFELSARLARLIANPGLTYFLVQFSLT